MPDLPARLDGAGPCRRCRAELDAIRRIADQSAALAGAGLHRLAAGDRAAALRLIRRASVLRTASDLAWILSALASGEGIGRRAWRSRSDRQGVAPSGAGVSRARVSQARRPQDRWRRPNSRRPLSPPLPFDGQPDLTCDAWPEIGHESLHMEPAVAPSRAQEDRASRRAGFCMINSSALGSHRTNAIWHIGPRVLPVVE